MTISQGLQIEVRPVDESDLRYCRASWAEDYKLSAGNHRMPWSAYKLAVEPELRRVLALPSTEILGAFVDGVIVGWIALSRGSRVSAVHWVRTRHSAPSLVPGVKFRRRGVMTALVDAAELGQRIVYTHRGPRPRHRADGVAPSDEWIVPWLGGRGIYAAHVPMKEWES